MKKIILSIAAFLVLIQLTPQTALADSQCTDPNYPGDYCQNSPPPDSACVPHGSCTNGANHICCYPDFGVFHCIWTGVDCVVNISTFDCTPGYDDVDSVCESIIDSSECNSTIRQACAPISGLTGYWCDASACIPCYTSSPEPECNPPEGSTCEVCQPPTPIPTGGITPIPPFQPSFCDPGEFQLSTGIGCLLTTPGGFLVRLYRILLFLAGGITLLLMIIGSFFILTSQGQPERVKRGKEIFTGAVTGLVFFIFATFLLELIGVDILGLF